MLLEFLKIFNYLKSGLNLKPGTESHGMEKNRAKSRKRNFQTPFQW